MELRPDTPNASLYELDAGELERKVLELELEAGKAFWNSWWVPDRVGRFCEAVYYASGALEEGARDAVLGGAEEQRLRLEAQPRQPPGE